LDDDHETQLDPELLAEELDELVTTGFGSAGSAAAFCAPGRGSSVNTVLSLTVREEPKNLVM
jgi:hypothetical protein